MKYTIFILCIAFAIFPLRSQNIRFIVESWDKETLSYLQDGYKKDYPNNYKIKEIFKNNCLIFNNKLNDTNSVRLKFFHTIEPILAKENADSFYIIESSNSGEMYVAYCYLVIPNKKSYYFVYNNQNWELFPKSIDIAYVESLYNANPMGYGLGENLNDVIITYFNVDKINCKYFLMSTIANNKFDIGR